MRARSKTRTADREARRALTVEVLGEQPWCAVAEPLAAALAAAGRHRAADEVRRECRTIAEHLHELRKSGAGGSRLARENVVGACDPCNEAVERWPIEARTAGLVIREGDPRWSALSKREDR